MSVRQRTRNMDILPNQENLTRQTVKQTVTKPLVTRRPALGEIPNKIEPRTNNVIKKPVTTKMGPPLNNKVTVKIQKQTTTIKTETVQKKADGVTVTQSTTSTLQRQESILSKQILCTENSKVGEEVSYSTKQLIGVIDADVNDKDDPFLVSEYIQDIFEYLRSLETKHRIRQNYMTNHCSTPRMRTILVNWMVDVHINFKFLFETLHLSVAILDRYLQLNKNIGRETLQLVGTTAMVIAGKYEEMYMPEIGDFVFVCDNTFSRSQILKMEQEILCKLKFNFGRPLSLHFLRRFNKVARVQSEHHNLAKYLLEICLLEYELCHIDPSKQAAAACCLSISILNDEIDPSKVWSKSLIYYSTYKYSDIKPVMISMAYFLNKMEKSKYQAVRNKYAGANCGKISLHPKLRGRLVKKLADEVQPPKKP